MKNTQKPEAKAGMKTEWNLGLLYSSTADPQIEKDMLAIEKVCADFEKKYKKADFVSTPEKLAKALADKENIKKIINGSKPWWYFALQVQLNSDDSQASAISNKYEQRLTNAQNKITFFSLEIAKIPKTQQKIFLKHSTLLPYHYLLERIFREAQYNLSEGEEQLSDLLSQTSYGMWVEGQEKVLNGQTIEYKEKQIPMPQAISILADLPKDERREMQNKINEKLKSISLFAEAEINAVYNYKKIMDERRGYKKAYSATVMGYENKEDTVENLVALVSKNFTISQRFYKIHAKLLGEEKILYADRAAKIGQVKKKFTYDQSIHIVRETFEKIGPRYSEIFDQFLRNGQLDVYPRKNKSGGAFCWGMGDNPTFILLNHTDDVRSVETLAHEMGHAIHTELSKSQPERYQKYSMSSAEVASTFFEQVVGAALENDLSENEKIIFLHNKILGDIQTIFRQIACFNFEKELHENIRKDGKVSREQIAQLLAKHMNAYTGKIMDVTENDGYTFVSWSHIRNFFYVYSYAFGQLVSRALFEKWKADPSYAQKIEKFLSAGRSMSPEDIFKSIGIDVTDPSFFESGLKSIEADIARLEKMAKKI